MLTFCNKVTVCMQTPTVRWQNSVVTSHHHQGSAGKQAGTEDLPAFNILFSSFHLNRKVYFHSIRWMCQSSSSASIYRNNFIICIFGIFFFSQKSIFGDILQTSDQWWQQHQQHWCDDVSLLCVVFAVVYGWREDAGLSVDIIKMKGCCSRWTKMLRIFGTKET